MFRSRRRGVRAALSLVVLAASAITVPLAASAPAAAAPPALVPVAENAPGPLSGVDRFLGSTGGRVVMIGDTPATGVEPFVYDPATDGWTLLADIQTGSNGSFPYALGSFGDRVLFAAQGPAGTELYITDGTPSGTALVKDINPGVAGSGPSSLSATTPVLGGFAYFTAIEATSGVELWRTDGTTLGTTLVKDIIPGTADSIFTYKMAVLGGHVYFIVGDVGAQSIWRSDGTADGTEAVASGYTVVEDLAVLGSTLLYSAQEPAPALPRLYRTDGTPGSAVPVEDLVGEDVIGPLVFVPFGGRMLMFGADAQDTNQGLWVSDGTDAGTTEIVSTLSFVFTNAPMTPVPNGVVFTAGEGLDQELWFSDGTTSGTRSFDILPGTIGSSPRRFVSHVDGFAYFIADALVPGGTTTRQLFRTDGSGFELVSDAVDPNRLLSVGDRVYLTAFTVATGEELYYLDAPPPVPSVAGTPVATAGSLSASVTWSASTALPAAPVTGYTVTASPGGASCSTSGALSCTVTGLSAGVSYTFTVVASNRIGSSVVSGVSNVVVPTFPPVASVSPGRILETRVGADLKTVDGLFQGIGRRAAGSTLELDVVGRSNVPADASAVMLNVTAVSPGADGFVTVFPCGVDRPNASSVNFRAGQVVPNAVLAKIGTGGKVCLFTTAETDLLVDVNGAVPAGGSPVTVSPARLLETRSGAGLDTVDGQFEGGGRLAAGGTLELLVAGRGNVPSNASAVMLNVTAVVPGADGFVTVFPCGEDRPNASSVNFRAGQVVPNAVLAKVGAGGKVCLFSTAATDLLVDVSGFVPAGSSPAPLTPARLLETRSGADLKTVDGLFQGIGRAGAGSTVELQVTGRGNVPSNATSVMLNVTAVVPGGAGFVTVFPCGEDRPLASSVNYQTGQVVPNAVLAKIGTGGKVCLFTTAATDLLVDVTAAI